MTDAQFIVRIAGLSADRIGEIASGSCGQAVSACLELETRLALARASLMDSLYRIVSNLTPSARHLAIRMKRFCYNARHLDSLIGSVGWEDVVVQLGAQVEEVLDLERKLTMAEDALSSLYDHEREQELRCLHSVARDLHLFRGISLASPELAAELVRLDRDASARPSRRRRSAERSLLRYVSRAALKTSPYSTLTRIGLGVVNGRPQKDRLELVGESWRETSLFRMKRSLVDQFFLVLSRHPEVRRSLFLRVNSTVEIVGPSRYRFLRPLTVITEAETGALRVSPPSHVKVKLEGPIVEYLEEALRGDVRGFHEVNEDLIERFMKEEAPEEARQRIEETLGRLIDLGFLELTPPWPSYELRLEAQLSEFLLSCGGGPRLRRIAEFLLGLVEEGDSYPWAHEPQRTLVAMQSAVNATWREISDLIESEVKISLPPEATGFYEDVFVSNQASEAAVVFLNREVARELLRCGDAVWKLFHLFNPRFNFIYTVTALLREQWPPGASVPFLDLFARAQPLWKDYVAALRRRKAEEYDPLLLERIGSLYTVRQEIGDWVRRMGETSCQFDAEDFEEITRRIPEAYDPIVGSCLFLQPGDRSGSLWALNRLFEGTGKYSSRFTAALTEPERSRFIERLREGSVFEVNGQRTELLDILYGHENTVNLHIPQTPKILELPGEDSRLPPGEKLSLADLFVRIDPLLQQAIIVDASNTRYLPCHLSSVASMFMPVLVKFLSVFGPSGYIPSLLPGWSSRTENSVLILDRLTFGRLVFRRKRWIVPVEKLPDPGLSDKKFFREVNAFIRRFPIDSRVFWIEPVRSTLDQGRYKPQFLDFSSPSFVDILQSRLGRITGNVTFEEVLPCQEDFPPGPGGSPYAVEIILDSLVERQR